MTIFTQEIKFQCLMEMLDPSLPKGCEFLRLNAPLSEADARSYFDSFHTAVYSSMLSFTVRTADGKLHTYPLVVVEDFPPEFTDAFTLLDYALTLWRGDYRVDEAGNPIQPSDLTWARVLNRIDFYKSSVKDGGAA